MPLSKMKMQSKNEVVLHGITREEIQQIFEDTIKRFRTIPKILYLDTSYLYTFDVSDLVHIYKFTDMIRISGKWIIGSEGGRRVFVNPMAVAWHHCLERWYNDQSVVIFGKGPIKPTAICRTVDRVPNEGLDTLAGFFVGIGDFDPMKYHAIGDGAAAGTNPSPAATSLVEEIDRIDVTQDPGGGALTKHGSTIFCIANHDIFVESFTANETGIFDSPSNTTDLMGDYSIFPHDIDHESGQDAVGSTTVIYQCSA
jgi:hypothetical protein